MKNLAIEKFTENLIENFPKFIQEMNPDDSQPYMIFGDFGIYIRNLIDRGNYNEAELNRIFQFLNEMGESSDKDVHNLLTVGILEIVIDSSEAIKISEKNLKGEALKDLILIHKYWSGQ